LTNECVFQSDNVDDERAVQEHELSLTQIDCVAIAPEGNRVAVGAHDNNIYIAELDTEGDIKETVRLLGHTSSVTHVDWSSDGLFLRSNSADYELLYWRSQDGEHLTTDAELEAIPSSWATHNWYLLLNTMFTVKCQNVSIIVSSVHMRRYQNKEGPNRMLYPNKLIMLLQVDIINNMF
jgi:WD40 repeat protein